MTAINLNVEDTQVLTAEEMDAVERFRQQNGKCFASCPTKLAKMLYPEHEQAIKSNGRLVEVCKRLRDKGWIRVNVGYGRNAANSYELLGSPEERQAHRDKQQAEEEDRQAKREARRRYLAASF